MSQENGVIRQVIILAVAALTSTLTGQLLVYLGAVTVGSLLKRLGNNG
jgi:hypothetical protein